ncbi:MAG TPA: FecR domain-containing protein [Thermoanaerobaculia bacterium]|nr:FecR domain-containing protein [Thermoanaerobaculia bacterium]
MNTRDQELDSLLDRAVDAVREDQPTPAVTRAAAERAWAAISAAAATAAPAADEPIRSCAEFQALMPAYLAGSLPPARTLLVEDHSRECIPCRRALMQLKSGEVAAPKASARPAISRPSRFPRRWLAYAATVLVAVGAASVALWNGPARGDIARVTSIDGMLFTLENGSPSPLANGALVAAGQPVRTGKGSGAVLTLADGSEVEIAERSEIAVTERGKETTIRVDRGSIIVEAAKQHGHLYVATDDCLVSVTGTIFSVSSGTKGSRVSVVEGEVRVAQGKKESVLHPGDQVATAAGLATSSVAADISWSRDHDRYVALMRELKALDAELEATLAAKGERTASVLLPLMPADTAIYLALPNVATEVADLERRFEERVAENPALSRWWQERSGQGSFGHHLHELFTRLSNLGQHLGEEVTVAVVPDAAGSDEGFVLLAEIGNAVAFRAALEEELARIANEDPGHDEVRIIDSPAEAAAGGEVFLWPAGNVFVASSSASLLEAVGANLADPAASPFRQSPFYARLADAYSHGVQWLGAVDVERMIAAEGPQGAERDFAGIGNVQYLIGERESAEGAVHTSAELTFDGPRQGVASWLAAPAPMGGLDYISPDASFAASFVIEEPAEILRQIAGFIESMQVRPGATTEADEQRALDLIRDLAAPLGGEIAFALDGPALPTPAWKVVAEVYDAAALQTALEQAVAEAATQAAAHGKPAPTLTASQSGGRTVWELAWNGQGWAVYTVDGGYLVATPNLGLLNQALSTKASGLSLVDSPTFTALLPRDGFVNFSALVWTSLGDLGQTLLSTAGQGLTEEQRQAISELGLDAPTLTCAYGEADRIRLVSTGQGGLFGSRLGTILGLSALSAAEGHGPRS